MTFYQPCQGCAFKPTDCEKKTEIRSAIKGLGITSLKFNCTERKPIYNPGDRVSLMWRVFEYGDPDPYGEQEVGEALAYFYATVMGEQSGTRYIVRVDDGPCYSIDEGWDPVEASKLFTRSSKLVVKVKTSDIAHTDEPQKEICTSCSAYAGERERCQGWGKPNSWDSYWPTECLTPEGARI